MNSSNLFKLVNFDRENFSVYFSYTGEEKISGNVRLSWKGLTTHHANFNFDNNPSVLYFIALTDKRIWDFVDYMDLIIQTGDVSQTFQIESSTKVEGFEFLNNFKTNEKDTPYYTFEEIFLNKVYEDEFIKVNEGDVVVDIGTNYGFFVQSIINNKPSEIHCYEPAPTVFERLKSNFSFLNNIKFYNEAVSSINGKTKFQDDVSTASNRISNTNDGYYVDTISIDSVIERINGRINYLKIDCEGCEKEIFFKISSDNLSKVDKVVVEYHSEEIKEVIVSRLNEEGFIIKKISNSIIFAFNHSLYKPKTCKKIVLISTFCDTEKKMSILKENLRILKGLNLDTMVISPNFLPVDEEVVRISDFVFYTKENPLLEYPIRQYTHWYEQQLSDGRVITLHRGFADYGWAALYQTKKLSQLALTFDYDLFYHIIYDLEIDDKLVNELIKDTPNLIHPRRNPNHPEEIWETTLHFMVFDREMMKKIEKEITLEEYLSTNGVAEGEVLKWTKKFDLKISEHCVKDKIFYWENFDFFNVSPYPEFKMFISKNPELQIWLGYDKPYSVQLGTNLRIVFYEIPQNFEIDVLINGESYRLNPNNWEFVEIPIDSKSIEEIKFIFNNKEVNFSKDYSEINMNQIFYNFRT